MVFEVHIKKWHGVANWTWNAGDEADVCGICRVHYEQSPPDVKFPGDDAPVVWGVCNHAFHLQCISKWLGSQQSDSKCPLCRRAWDFRPAEEAQGGAPGGQTQPPQAANQQQQQQQGTAQTMGGT